MKAKLTLSIDQEKIIKIKRYSKKSGYSVSKLLEDFIDNVDTKPNRKKLNIMKLKGAFGKAPKNFDWKKIKAEYLLQKYVR